MPPIETIIDLGLTAAAAANSAKGSLIETRKATPDGVKILQGRARAALLTIQHATAALIALEEVACTE